MTPSAAVNGLGEIALRVRDLSTMTAFYRDAVGLEVIRESERSVFLRIADGVEGHPQVLALFDQAVPPYATQGRTEREPHAETSTLHHLALTISKDDHTDEMRRLQNLGLDVTTAQHEWLLAGMPQLSGSSKARHLRVLRSCLAAAQASGYTGRNAVALLGKGERPRPGKREAAYFTNAELSAIFQATPADTLFGVLFRLALVSGARLGELSALQWGDLDLLAGEMRVRRSITDKVVGVPKNHQARTINLPPATIDMLGHWWGVVGEPDDDALVFPTPRGYLSQKSASNHLKRSMKAGDVTVEGPTGARRTFHSFRHSSARIALEHGVSLDSLMRRLGHGSIGITIGVYGHWESDARKREAAKLDTAFVL